MSKVIVLFNLKSEAQISEYEAWAKQTDIPSINALKSVENFSIHKATGLLGSEERSPYDYIEIIDVANMDDFSQEITTDTIQAIAKQFANFAENPKFILIEELS